MSNYQHIESLVRDLHTAKNIPQPEQILNPNANNNLNKPLLMTTHPCRSIVSNAHHKLRVHQLSPVHPPPPLCMIIDEEEYVESKTNTMTLRLLSNDNSTKTSKGNDVNCSTPIPSVMVNDVNEPLDLISTTHRRFSQLYSGLRRLSTSNTVGLYSNEC